MMPPPGMNATELARKARIRLEQTRKDIVEMNERITKLINEAFGSRPYGDDYHKDRRNGQHNKEGTEKQRDEQVPNGNQTHNVITYQFKTRPIQIKNQPSKLQAKNP
jgi:hypothetical protein